MAKCLGARILRVKIWLPKSEVKCLLTLCLYLFLVLLIYQNIYVNAVFAPTSMHYSMFLVTFSAEHSQHGIMRR